MRKVCVNDHVLTRWEERVGYKITKKNVINMFRKNNINILERGNFNRYIVKVKDAIFVVRITNTRIYIYTTYGRASEYSPKNPDSLLKDNSIKRWEKQVEYEAKERSGRW